jgi:uncharacterized cysteine cluster protein YcgN (CxxCxxCC family)
MDDIEYSKKQEKDEAAFEALCKRCGACCGRDDEPCSNLAADSGGNYYCKAYDARIGPQTTINGCVFTCVSIREVLKYSLPCPGCGYALEYDSGRCI